MEESYKGNDRLIFGIGVGILTYWLFSQALLNTVPDVQQDLAINTEYYRNRHKCYIFIFWYIRSSCRWFRGQVWCSKDYDDRFSFECHWFYTASYFNWIYYVISGRIIQGLSAACIMPSTLSLIKSYYKDEQRQRALSFGQLVPGEVQDFVL